MIDITGLDKVKVLQALYASAKPLGMGMLQYVPGPLSTAEAEKMLASDQHYFDYVKGRIMKVDLSKDTLNPRPYDRDNGEGSAARAIESIR